MPLYGVGLFDKELMLRKAGLLQKTSSSFDCSVCFRGEGCVSFFHCDQLFRLKKKKNPKHTQACCVRSWWNNET